MVTAFVATLVLARQTALPPAPVSIPISVDGDGYIRLVRSGKHVFTKSCTIVVKMGRLAASDGPDLLPIIRVQGQPDGLTVALDGRISASYSGTSRVLGRIVLGDFTDDVRPVKSGNYWLCYGEPALGNPGDGSLGLIRTGLPDATTSTTITAPEKSVPHGPVAPTLKDQAVVASDSFTVGDISTNSGAAASVLVGDTPAVGIDRVVSRELIESKIRQAGIKDYKLSGAARVVVKRESQQVSHQDFVETALAKAKEGKSVNFVTLGPTLPAMEVPKGTLEIIPESIVPSGTNLSVVVAVFVDGKRYNSRTILLHAEASASTKSISVGSIVTIKIIKGSATIETKGRVISVDSATGQVTVEAEPTKVHLTGKATTNGSVEVNA